MPLIAVPPSPILELSTVEIIEAHVQKLQRFYEANPEYSIAVTGERPGPNDAREELYEDLPEGWSFTKKWLIGYLDDGGNIVAVVDVVSDLLAPTVWHIGSFMVVTARHGNGTSQRIYGGLEEWAASNGAQWLRLGVVQGNARAEKFWEKLGFVQVRTRSGVVMGRLTNTIRVMVKPLGTDALEHYFSLVERDRPDAQNAA